MLFWKVTEQGESTRHKASQGSSQLMLKVDDLNDTLARFKFSKLRLKAGNTFSYTLFCLIYTVVLLTNIQPLFASNTQWFMLSIHTSILAVVFPPRVPAAFPAAVVETCIEALFIAS